MQQPSELNKKELKLLSAENLKNDRINGFISKRTIQHVFLYNQVLKNPKRRIIK